MAEIVLINPASLPKDPTYKSLAEVEGVRPPPGILPLGSYLKSKGYGVKLINVNPYSM